MFHMILGGYLIIVFTFHMLLLTAKSKQSNTKKTVKEKTILSEQNSRLSDRKNKDHFT